MNSPLTVGLLVFALVLSAGVVPLLLKLSDRVLHAVVALACGFFLGVTFLHLLPEVAHQGAPTTMWSCVLAGMLAVFFAEVMLRHDEPHEPADPRAVPNHEHHEHHDAHDHHGQVHLHAHALPPEHPAHHGGHRVVGIATFVGLAVHTLGGAIGIGLAFGQPEFFRALVTATLSHKSAEAFSLVTVLLLAGFSRRRIVLLLSAYALVTPVGIAIGRLLAGWLTAAHLEEQILGPAEGLAAGTFLYVAVGELLPEVFHGRTDRGRKIVLLLVGLAAAALLFGQHLEEH